MENFNARELSNTELLAIRNLAQFEQRTIVIGDGIFAKLLPYVEQELQRRNIA